MRGRARRKRDDSRRGGVLSAGAAASHGEDVSEARPARDRWLANERPGWRARETGPGRRASGVDACRVGASARGHALFMSSRSRFAAGADPGEPPSAVRRAARGSSGSRRPAGTPGRRIASGEPRLGSPARPRRTSTSGRNAPCARDREPNRGCGTKRAPPCLRAVACARLDRPARNRKERRRQAKAKSRLLEHRSPDVIKVCKFLRFAFLQRVDRRSTNAATRVSIEVRRVNTASPRDRQAGRAV